MRILVTGAAGFIGSHLAEKLVEEGHDVVGLDCYTGYYARELKESNAREVLAKGVKLQELDLAGDELAPAVDGVEIVYHCAAQPGISAMVPISTYVRNNLMATHRLQQALEGSETLRCFINIATSSVYGKHATDSEDTPPKPTSYYGVTKLAAEQLVLASQREKGFPACSLRLFSVYGPRERPEKLFPILLRCLHENTPLPLFEGSEKHSRSFTFIDDIIKGFLAVLDHLDECNGEVFNIGSDIEITTARGIAIIEELIGRKVEILKKPKRPGDQLRTHANIDKARRVLGYSPETTPEEGLSRTVEWFRKINKG
ncbi:MAG: NAD-dependent epimerase/dehydratase family protein [Planctomycetes bacterium]|nr:NAD-dependent epimerase/dehydratase family protein [Planctomycetota bacterium]